MNPKSLRASAAGPPEARKVTSGVAAFIATSVLSPSITIPLSVHFVGRSSAILAVLVGLVPALPVLLPVGALAAVFLLGSVVMVAVTIGRVLRHHAAASECLDDMFAWMVNPPISLLRLRPYKPPKRARRSESAPEVSRLPEAPGEARPASEAIYYQTVLDMSAQPGGRPDVIPPRQEADTEPILPIARPARGSAQQSA